MCFFHFSKCDTSGISSQNTHSQGEAFILNAPCKTARCLDAMPPGATRLLIWSRPQHLLNNVIQGFARVRGERFFKFMSRDRACHVSSTRQILRHGWRKDRWLDTCTIYIIFSRSYRCRYEKCCRIGTRKSTDQTQKKTNGQIMQIARLPPGDMS